MDTNTIEAVGNIVAPDATQAVTGLLSNPLILSLGTIGLLGAGVVAIYLLLTGQIG